MLGENIAAKPSQSVQNDNADDTVAANQRPSVSLPYWFFTVLIGSQRDSRKKEIEKEVVKDNKENLEIIDPMIQGQMFHIDREVITHHK